MLTLPSAQALLITGNDVAHNRALAEESARLQLCASPVEAHACGVCDRCLLQAGHPDFLCVAPESKIISVDQIRELVAWSFIKPHYVQGKIALILPGMNRAAMNSLLKLLEEPPHQLRLILLAEHTHSVLPTILSRCQIFPGFQRSKTHDFLKSQPLFIDEVFALCEHSLLPATLASRWKMHELPTMMMALQDIVLDFIKMTQGLAPQFLEAARFKISAAHLSVIHWYRVLDRLQAVEQSRSIHLNVELCLIEILMAWIGEREWKK